MSYIYKENMPIPKEDLIDLYTDANRTSYIEDPDKLKRAVDNSLYNLTVWRNDELIGLIRVVGDDETIIYIQDIVVKKEYKDGGIDSHLLKMIIERYKDCWEILVHTKDCKENRCFYEGMGMHKSKKYDTIAFVKYNI